MKIKTFIIKYWFIILCVVVIAAIAASLLRNPVNRNFFTAGGGEQETVTAGDSGSTGIINIYTFDNELDYILKKYAESHPEFKYQLHLYDQSMTGADSLYWKIINDMKKDETFIDLYCVPAAYSQDFIKGEYSKFACPYNELGIHVKKGIKKADIPQFAIDVGTNPEGDLIALPYESDLGLFMYRRSIAREVWGTDAPEEIAQILGAGTGKWDGFLEAAQELKDHGCYIVPACTDIWPLIDVNIGASNLGFEEDDKIDPKWEEFLDISKTLLDSDCMKNTIQYSEEWFKDLSGQGDKPVFGTVPANFFDWEFQTMGFNATAGDWAMCRPPVGDINMSDRSGLLVNKNSQHKEQIRRFIEWATLDSSKKGLQYSLAKGTVSCDPSNPYSQGKRAVLSGTVLKAVNTNLDFLGGQNVNPLVEDAQKAASRKNKSDKGFEDDYAWLWLNGTEAYLRGEKNRDAVIAEYKKEAKRKIAFIDKYFYNPVSTTLNVYTLDSVLHNLIENYSRFHPEFKYKVTGFSGSTISDEWLLGLMAGILEKKDGVVGAIDIYSVPSSYAQYFIKGGYSSHACTYKELGIDIEAALKKAKIPQYAIDDGTNPDGELIALPHESSVGVFMYRRSIAKEVWGTDEPEEIARILGADTGKWDKFLQAAQTLKEHGCYITPGCGDIWPLVDTGINLPELRRNENYQVDPKWLEFMDISRNLFDSGCVKDTLPWSEQWYADLYGKGDKPVFGLVTSIELVASGLLKWQNDYDFESLSKDLAVCLPPVVTVDMSDHTGVMVNRDSALKDEIRPLIEWLTLDCSEKGLQYLLANGTFFSEGDYQLDRFYGGKWSVVSGTVLQKLKSPLDYLGGQNINPVIDEAQQQVKGRHQIYTGLESLVALEWLNATNTYIKGEKDRETAIAEFKKIANNCISAYLENYNQNGLDVIRTTFD